MNFTIILLRFVLLFIKVVVEIIVEKKINYGCFKVDTDVNEWFVNELFCQ